LYFSGFDGLAGNRFIERAVIDEVIYELMGLSDQEYVDIYAATLKNNGNGSAPAQQSSSRIPQTAAG
jgi:1-acyl-sn-glycerol-3-phosphate acyltransferase